MQARDYYEVLQIDPAADGPLLEQAYWRLARLYNAAIRTDPAAGERLDELNEAYRVLGASESRREYDRARSGSSAANGSPQHLGERASAWPALAEAAGRRQARPLLSRFSSFLKRSSFWRGLPWPLVVSNVSALALAIMAVVTGAPPVLTLGFLVLAVVFASGAVARKLGLLPRLVAGIAPADVSRPTNVGGGVIPGGRSQAVRRVVYQIYAQYPHLGPGDLQAVARYAMLSQRFLRTEQRLRRLKADTPETDAHNLAVEQRTLAAELRRHEASLGIASGARAPSRGGEWQERPSERRVEVPSL